MLVNFAEPWKLEPERLFLELDAGASVEQDARRCFFCGFALGFPVAVAITWDGIAAADARSRNDPPNAIISHRRPLRSDPFKGPIAPALA